MFDLNMLIILDGYLQGIDDLEKRYKSLERDKDLVLLDQNRINLQRDIADTGNLIRSTDLEADETLNRLKVCSSRLEHLNKSLYDGSIKDLKQLEHMERELNTLKELKEELEWKQLQCVETLEELAERQASIDEKLSSVKEEFSARRSEVRLEASIIKSEINRLKNEAEIITSKVDIDLLSTYYKIRSKKGTGAALIEGNICTGCNMMIATTIIDRIKMGKQIYFCETCGRIHVIPRE